MRLGSSYSVVPTALAAYAALLVIQLQGGELKWSLLAVPAILFFALRKADELHRGGIIRGPAAATRGVLFGASVFFLSRFAPSSHTTAVTLGSLGLLLSSMGAFYSVARAEGPQGLLSGHPAASSLDALFVGSILWSFPLTFALAKGFVPSLVAISNDSLEWGLIFASLGSVFLLLSVLLRVALLRGLELGVFDRAKAATSLTIAGVMTAAAATVVSIGRPAEVIPSTVLIVSALIYLAFATNSAERVTIATRATTALCLFTAPIVLGGSYLALQFPNRPVTTLSLTALLAALSGVLSRAIARPRGPAESSWLDPLELASERSLHPDARAALREVLLALVPLDRKGTTRPELYVQDPPSVLSVDIAGYLTERKADFPQLLFELAAMEPEQVLRLETLERAQIRRPPLQASVAWFDVRKTKAIVALSDDVGAVGLLVCPAGGRKTHLTLEEVTRLGQLGRRVASLLTQSSSVMRAELKAISERELREASETTVEKLKHELEENQAVVTSEATMLAETQRRLSKSPAARLCLESLEKRTERKLYLRTPTGVNPRGYAAHFHLARSTTSASPFVIIDGAEATLRSETSTIEHPEIAKKLALASRGTLLIENAAALSTQSAESIAEQLKKGDFFCVLSSSDPAQIKAPLHCSPGEEIVSLPGLSERGEDLMAMMIDELTRLGLSRRGSPYGLARPVMMALLDREYPGNDEELKSLLFRGACRAGSEVITYEDLFGEAGQTDDEPSSPPPRARARIAPRSYRRD